MRRTRTVIALAVAVVSAIALTACAGTASAGKNSSTLTLAVGHPLGALNPRVLAGDFPAQDLIFEPLIRYGTNGKLIPALATSWTTSPDGLTTVFELRKGVKFTDGQPFDAAAAKWNFDQWVGKKDYLSIGSSQRISSVTATGTYQLTMTLSEPYSAFLNELTLIRPVRFASPKSVTAAGKYLKPIGTGPYSLGRNDNQGATMLANTSYWGGTPRYKTLAFKIIDDSGSRTLALRSGQVDLIGGDWLSPISPVEADQLKQSTKVKVVTGPGFSTVVLGFNFGSGPASSVAVRRAVSAALDPAVLAKVFYRGYAAPATALYPKVIANAPTTTPIPFDVAAAKTELDNAGWTLPASGTVREKGGTPLTLSMVISEAVYPGARLLSQQVQAALAKVGIKVDIQTVDATTYADRVSRGQYDLAFYTTYGAPYDPLTSLTFFFLSNGDRVDGRIFQSPEIDAGILAAQKAVGTQQETAAYQSVYNAMAKDVAFVPLVWPDRIWATRAGLPNFSLAPTEYGLPLQMLVKG